MIEKKIEVCIGTDRAKNIRARLSLLVVEGDAVLSEQYHSISIEPGSDMAAVREANEAHIGDPNGGIPGAPWPQIPDDAWSDVEKHVAIIHKPEFVSAVLERKAQQALARKEQQELEKAQLAKVQLEKE